MMNVIWLFLLYWIGLILFLFVTGADQNTFIIASLLAFYHSLLAFSRTLMTPAQAAANMAMPAAIEFGGKASAVVIAIGAVAFFEASLEWSMVAFPLGGIGALLASRELARRSPIQVSVSTAWAQVRQTVRDAWPFAAGSIVFRIYSRADVILLTLLIGSGVAGVYISGLKFAELALALVGLLGFALYPALSRAFEAEVGAFRSKAVKLIRAGLVLSILIACGLYFVLPFLLVPILGSEFAEAVPVAKLLALLAPAAAITIVFDRLLLAANQQHLKLKIQIGATGLNVVLNLILIPYLGIPGAIYASIISMSLNGGAAMIALDESVGKRSIIISVCTFAVLFVMGVVIVWGIFELCALQPLVQLILSMGALGILGMTWWALSGVMEPIG